MPGKEERMPLVKNDESNVDYSDIINAKIKEERIIRDIVKRIEQRLKIGYYRTGGNAGAGLVSFTDVELEFRND